jgi:hypothetical protein
MLEERGQQVAEQQAERRLLASEQVDVLDHQSATGWERPS